ncbi:MAG: dTDP-4-dehydrorhamnose reductase [uncultured Sphingomonadaceae bacterium]|uniref:dTDP-4-dehydrorhamnose reductase n=1 Tax=uncultured Sphingomonadaceae bacterium TaxID=169976 RepID=A0A6J4RWU3_9SPHN|nr:MAG: dTDP-4-dehydrorhamnose reductase [uncultured Sphingomonadaceae bacterium]
MRLMITGRDGQLVRSLIRRGANIPGLELVALGRPELDLEQPGSAARAITAHRPDAIVNAAAYTAVDQAEDEPDRAVRINGEAAGEIAAAAAALGAPLIQLSTDYVFDGRAGGPRTEDAPVSPLGSYGRSKLLGEQLALAANSRTLVLRTAWVYSPFGRNFLKTMLTLARDRDALTVVADQRGNPSSALDLADGILAVLRTWEGGARVGQGGTYHLAGTGDATWCEFAAAIMVEAAAAGLPAARVSPIATAHFPTKAPRPADSTLDSSKFARDFAFRMPDWRRSTAEVIAEIARAA